jgi:hypothetical protein
MAQPTWLTREVPILEAIAEIEAVPKASIWMNRLAEITRLSERDAGVGFLALVEDGFVTFGTRTGSGENFLVVAPKLRGKGRRAVGQWPPDGMDALARLLEERIASEPDEDKRSRLIRLRDALADLSQDVLRGVLTDWARRLPEILTQ